MEWLDSLNGRIVGLDTAPLIYFIERHPTFIVGMRDFFQAMDRDQFLVVTSTVTLLEVLVHPLRHNNQRLADQYRDILFDSRGLTTVSMQSDIAEKAAELRAKYAIRTPDAIQVATSLREGATFFLTNDVRLSAISELNVLVLDQLTQ